MLLAQVAVTETVSVLCQIPASVLKAAILGKGPGLFLTFSCDLALSLQCCVWLCAPLGDHLLPLHEEGGTVGLSPAGVCGAGAGLLQPEQHIPGTC